MYWIITSGARRPKAKICSFFFILASRWSLCYAVSQQYKGKTSCSGMSCFQKLPIKWAQILKQSPYILNYLQKLDICIELELWVVYSQLLSRLLMRIKLTINIWYPALLATRVQYYILPVYVSTIREYWTYSPMPHCHLVLHWLSTPVHERHSLKQL